MFADCDELRLVRRPVRNGRVDTHGVDGGFFTGRDRLSVSGGIHSVLSAQVSGSSTIGYLER